jgi:hypothetical protein
MNLYDMSHAQMNLYDMSQWPKRPEHDVSVVAVGGFPVVSLPYDWKRRLKEGFGQGAVLTFGNPNQKSLVELADMCGQRGHLWWMGVLSMTWLVCGEPAVELEIGRSGLGHLSWQENVPGWHSNAPDWLHAFLVCFDLNTARKYFKHADDPDFKPSVRRVLSTMRDDLREVCPWAFPTSSIS